MKRFYAVVLLVLGVLFATVPAMAQYGGGGMGGGLGGGNNDAPPPAPPPGSVGNPPPKMAPPKYFDGDVTDITGTVVTVQYMVAVPGSSPVPVVKKFELCDKTQYEPTDWKVTVKSKVRVIYEMKDDKLYITKVIRSKDTADL